MDTLEHQIKEKLIKALDLELSPEEIDDDAPLFGEEGIGLDSVDGLEAAAMLQADFAVEIPNRTVADKVLASIRAMADYVRQQRGEG